MVAYVISVLGHKGGGGKTTCSHLLAHGLASLGYGVFHAATDSIQKIKSSENRPYITYSAKTDAELRKVINAFDVKTKKAKENGNSKDIFLILDGGANKIKLDMYLHEVSTLTIVPVKPSGDDTDGTYSDLERFKLRPSYALRNEWPPNPSGARLADKELSVELGELSNRVLEFIIKRSSDVKRVSNDKKVANIAGAKDVAIDFALHIASFLSVADIAGKQKIVDEERAKIEAKRKERKAKREERKAKKIVEEKSKKELEERKAKKAQQ